MEKAANNQTHVMKPGTYLVIPLSFVFGGLAFLPIGIAAGWIIGGIL